jgi:Uma2 family endonuclease
MAEVLEDVGMEPMVLRTEDLRLTDDEFFDFCVRNKGWRIERAANGNIEIMLPAGCAGSSGNAELTFQFKLWARKEGTGRVFDCSAGFKLPNRAVRSPDVAWVRKSRLKAFSRAAKEKFLPLCPDFVLELRSPSDRYAALQRKMEEYIRYGARLGWLLEPNSKEVSIYRPGERPEILVDPEELSGESVLKGFILDVQAVWEQIDF